MPVVHSAVTQSFSASSFREFRVLPAGVFRTADGSGRPDTVAGWIMNTRIAHGIIASLAARKDDVLIDYEHQSLTSAKTGGLAPAAGWFKHAEWRDGDGLYAIDVRWTSKAAAMIAAKEYRFISPVFEFDKRTGEVTKLLSAGLVNQPALSGLTDLAAASALQSDAEHSIYVFNRTFASVGVFHPHTAPAELARLRAEYGTGERVALSPKPAKVKPCLAGMSADEAAKMRRWFPGTFA